MIIIFYFQIIRTFFQIIRTFFQITVVGLGGAVPVYQYRLVIAVCQIYISVMGFTGHFLRTKGNAYFFIAI